MELKQGLAKYEHGARVAFQARHGNGIREAWPETACAVRDGGAHSRPSVPCGNGHVEAETAPNRVAESLAQSWRLREEIVLRLPPCTKRALHMAAQPAKITEERLQTCKSFA